MLTREPGGTVSAEAIRQILKQKSSEEVLQPKTELLLMYAARIQTIECVVKPALARGDWVISDRHALSTYAYQGGGRGIAESLIDTIHHIARDDFAPECTLYLDITPELGFQRVKQRGQAHDRFEQESRPFFEKIRQYYLAQAQRDARIITINATQSLEQVHSDIAQALQSLISTSP